MDDMPVVLGIDGIVGWRSRADEEVWWDSFGLSCGVPEGGWHDCTVRDYAVNVVVCMVI